MPKINQEEYEILKELDDKWKWIARDEDSASVEVFQVKPYKAGTVWLWEGYTRIDDIGGTKLFQFIQWEDEEPYYIPDLIEEYEKSRKRCKEHTTQSTESEGKEVKKDIEWLREELDLIENEAENILNNYSDRGPTVYKVEERIHSVETFRHLLDRLDEPETLSQEWIDEHVDYEDVRGGTQAFIHVDDLQNLLVPKQEVLSDEQAYDKIAESFPATAKEIESVLEKYYSSMLIEFSEELHESIMRAFDVEETSKTIEALTGMALEQIAEEARNGGIVTKQELPVIPKFVAEFLIGKEDYMLYELFDDEWLYKEHERVAKWLYDNDELTNKQREIDLVMARDRGYTVEERELTVKGVIEEHIELLKKQEVAVNLKPYYDLWEELKDE